MLIDVPPVRVLGHGLLLRRAGGGRKVHAQRRDEGGHPVSVVDAARADYFFIEVACAFDLLENSLFPLLRVFAQVCVGGRVHLFQVGELVDGHP